MASAMPNRSVRGKRFSALGRYPQRLKPLNTEACDGTVETVPLPRAPSRLNHYLFPILFPLLFPLPFPLTARLPLIQ